MNNGGWGLRIMLLFCGLLVFALTLSAVIIKSQFDNLTPNSGNQIDEDTYYDLEVKMINATKKYVTEYYLNSLTENALITVTVKTLENEQFLNNLIDYNTKSECSGYVSFIKTNNKIEYNPYLNCGNNYTTEGYNTEFDTK